MFSGSLPIVLTYHPQAHSIPYVTPYGPETAQSSILIASLYRESVEAPAYLVLKRVETSCYSFSFSSSAADGCFQNYLQIKRNLSYKSILISQPPFHLFCLKTESPQFSNPPPR